MNWDDHGKPFLLMVCVAIFWISLIVGVVANSPTAFIILIISVIGMYFISANLRKNSNDRMWEEAKKKFSQSYKN